MRQLTEGHRYWVGLPNGDIEQLFLIPTPIKGNTLQYYRKHGTETIAIPKNEWERLLKHFEWKMRIAR